MARKATARAPRPNQINPNCPPLMVRYKPNGMITNWSSLFQSELANVEPYFRPGTTDREDYIVACRRFEAMQAMQQGNPFIGGAALGSAFADGIIPDAASLGA